MTPPDACPALAPEGGWKRGAKGGGVQERRGGGREGGRLGRGEKMTRITISKLPNYTAREFLTQIHQTLVVVPRGGIICDTTARVPEGVI